jgi:hypothetical protein
MRRRNIEKYRERDKLHYQKNREQKLRWQKQYGEIHREERLEYLREYRAKHKTRIAKQQLEYVKTNRAEISAKQRVRLKNRYHSDVCYKLASVLRARLYQALKKNYKRSGTMELLGCTLDEFRSYIENQFTEGMTWDNWAKDGWHIDHIQPISHFDLTDPEQLRAACHYSNLRPLWARQNISEGNRRPRQTQQCPLKVA